MKVLVFGGCGFLGSYVADELASRKHKVTVFDQKRSDYLAQGRTFIQGDILDQQQVLKAVKGFDVVYNFAGLADLNASLNLPIETIRLNVMGNTFILDACRQHSIKRFVYASSAYAFSNKGSFYGVSKHCSEKIIEEYSNRYKLPYTILRYGSVYGERADNQNRIYRIIKDAITSGKITFQGNGEEEREYIHARDAAMLSVDILDKKYENRHMILTGIERFKYKEILNMIREILNDKVKIKFMNQAYKGHYEITPYSFVPKIGHKIVSNPHIDMGQGLLEIIQKVYREGKHDGEGGL